MTRFIKFLLTPGLVLVFLLQAQQTSAIQGSTVDSLLGALKITQQDTFQVTILNQLTEEFIQTSAYEKALQYAKNAQSLSEKIDFKKGEATSSANIGTIYRYLGDYEKAQEYYLKSLKTWEKIHNKSGIATAYNKIGIMFIIQGDYEKALEAQLKSLKISDEIKDSAAIAYTYNSIGVIYWKKGNYDLAMKNYVKCFEIWENAGNKKGMAVFYNNVGIIYNEQKNYDKALENYIKSLKICEEIGDQGGIAQTYNNIGSIYYERGNNLLKKKQNREADIEYGKALDSHFQSLKIRLENRDQQGIAMSYNNIGSVYMKQEKFQDALEYLKKSLAIFQELGDKDGVKDSYYSLSDLYAGNGDYKRAVECHKLYSDIKDSILNEQSSKQMAEMNVRYDSEKKDKELLKKDAEITTQQAETEKKNLQRNIVLTGFVLMLILAFFIYKGYNQKRNINLKLEEKNELINKQKQLVEEKNEKITDSINYAKRIQQAILPSQATIKSVFPDSFVLFKPKDIVSGDFYWITLLSDSPRQLAEENPNAPSSGGRVGEGYLILAAADCTGHGVPGALMSVMGYNLLEQIVKEQRIEEPSAILNELSKSITEVLKQTDEVGTIKDGMDIALCKINYNDYTLEYSGAHNPLYLIRNDVFTEIKADRRTVGIAKSAPFTNHKIKIEKGDSVYLFSDGFVDQKGGPENKKFFYKPFQNLLVSIHKQPMDEQQAILEHTIMKWKGNNEQMDDILVIGVKV